MRHVRHPMTLETWRREPVWRRRLAPWERRDRWRSTAGRNRWSPTGLGEMGIALLCALAGAGIGWILRALQW
jgi:hypothetical protein